MADAGSHRNTAHHRCTRKMNMIGVEVVAEVRVNWWTGDSPVVLSSLELLGVEVVVAAAACCV